MGGTASARDMHNDNTFLYDSEGNLIEDRSKGLKISYDWRGMPTEFIIENNPKNAPHTTRDCGGLGTMLRIAYDGSGRRISKTRLCKVDDNAWETAQVTHYTGIGTEVRENFHNGSLDETKVVVNMPQGLGRYHPEDAVKVSASAELDENGKLKDASSALSSAFLDEKGTLEDAVKVFTSETFDENGCSSGECHPGLRAGIHSGLVYEFYLKNHLGSTMMVAQVNSSNANEPAKIAAAYDYRAFGEQIDLTVPTDKVTENFTGKEKDDETDLNYFGARYLDPMLGLWISVDAKRQFSSPYLYAGNGANPVNGVDRDGNVLLFAPGSSPEFKAEFSRTIKYLNNGKSSSIIANLHKRKEVVYVREISEAAGDEDGFIRRDGELNAPVIDWDPYSAFAFGEGVSQSPALGFLHEADHALESLQNPAEYSNGLLVKDKLFDDNEERRVIQGSETRAARKLGEDVRDSHGGVSKFVEHSDER